MNESVHNSVHGAVGSDTEDHFMCSVYVYIICMGMQCLTWD
jgi:hypothetical protein